MPAKTGQSTSTSPIMSGHSDGSVHGIVFGAGKSPSQKVRLWGHSATLAQARFHPSALNLAGVTRPQRNVLVALWLMQLVFVGCGITLVVIGEPVLGVLVLVGVGISVRGVLKFQRAVSKSPSSV
jgi:hypothetical protein